MARIVPFNQVGVPRHSELASPPVSEQKVQNPPGLHIGTLEAGDELTVRTRNSTYSLVVLRPTERKVLIRGGRFFGRSVEATLLGSSSPLETHEGRVARSFSLEVLANGCGYVTSPVEAIKWESRSRSQVKNHSFSPWTNLSNLRRLKS